VRQWRRKCSNNPEIVLLPQQKKRRRRRRSKERKPTQVWRSKSWASSAHNNKKSTESAVTAKQLGRAASKRANENPGEGPIGAAGSTPFAPPPYLIYDDVAVQVTFLYNTGWKNNNLRQSWLNSPSKQLYSLDLKNKF